MVKAKSMNQFFYNMDKTIWALKHVLFLIDCNKLSRCTVKENKSLYYPKPATLSQATVERKPLTWSLKLAMKTSLLRINYNENVGKRSKNTQ